MSRRPVREVVPVHPLGCVHGTAHFQSCSGTGGTAQIQVIQVSASRLVELYRGAGTGEQKTGLILTSLKNELYHGVDTAQIGPKLQPTLNACPGAFPPYKPGPRAADRQSTAQCPEVIDLQRLTSPLFALTPLLAPPSSLALNHNLLPLNEL